MIAASPPSGQACAAGACAAGACAVGAGTGGAGARTGAPGRFGSRARSAELGMVTHYLRLDRCFRIFVGIFVWMFVWLGASNLRPDAVHSLPPGR
jgi:hypothetical protein